MRLPDASASAQVIPSAVGLVCAANPAGKPVSDLHVESCMALLTQDQDLSYPAALRCEGSLRQRRCLSHHTGKGWSWTDLGQPPLPWHWAYRGLCRLFMFGFLQPRAPLAVQLNPSLQALGSRRPSPLPESFVLCSFTR